MQDLWYKNAVIYCVDVDAFLDADGDGIGDFRGLADRLDHIESLGATCIWLMPFFPSPNRDNGYDITDYYGIDPRLGSPGDFVAFTRAAHDHGLRVLIDLVVNHTSTDHPWFQSARSSPDSPYRDWYVWSKEKPENHDEGVVFPGVQEAIWTWDDMAGAWYLHRFYDHQADLNLSNPAVREEIERIMGYWLQLGVSGFRLDAVPFLIEEMGEDGQRQDQSFDYLDDMHRFLSWRRAESVLLAEANVPTDEASHYFGGGERMQMIFDFPLNQHVFLSLARGEAEPIARILRAAPDLPQEAQWGTFLRNHDELDLGRLPESEREEIFDAMAPDPSMIIYDRGIRRRLAPMLGGDLARLKLAYALLFALPGTPVIFYGEEIGMGENLALSERSAVRTPLQWSPARNGGFSAAAPEDLVRALPEDPRYAPATVSIRAQNRDETSLLNFIRQVVRTRRAHPEIGWGRCEILDTDPRVLGLAHRWRGNPLLTFHNLSQTEVTVEIGEAGDWCPVLGADSAGTADAALRLPPWGYCWLSPRDGSR